ncbi:bifunctional prephenate dehydrogenase/3-phosphoshikimate 1-carboxyvinyltransferase [Entomomonas sp. E2T0]|uniref:bifunctional prephenate dehydrogenase/3-phosphoshikimate 1-carboxyvinyltransferase n=1 Tax=Entomomonas sp. E2T0 TaxID=2930213 RepID=UPI00222834F7|nr:bifunctional prephenate dehydrogenase/3-phosphoshikimate 1-carboxyvinyltransferase [Entomomonas sp. E2T0]UYZ83690.1 bifunctional prephenate dehydrogenase/3-phosphoshikimate 1-carboxyvinyltransferase [Entomomonas sp. E2T0]
MAESTTEFNYPKLDKVTVIGLGLIGGSFAKAIKERGLSQQVVGFDKSVDTCQIAIQNQVIDHSAASLIDACQNADLIVLAIPILAVEKLLPQLAELDLGKAVITDVGSVKGNIVDAVRLAMPDQLSIFVPGHPIAGSERSGIEAANSELFVNHKVILTPNDQTSLTALQLVTSIWRTLGADVEQMSVEHHDEILAATSHLPHLLAYGLVDCLAKNHDNLDIFRYAAGGFRDFTRIAGSDPIMWHDIFLANKKAVLAVLDSYMQELNGLYKAVEEKNGTELLDVFTRAKAARGHFNKILEDRANMNNKSQQPTDLIFIAKPVKKLSGQLQVPGDKSISHRSIIFGSLAEGVTTVDGFLEGEDALATLQAFRDMGVTIDGPDEGRVVIHGVGMRGLKAPSGAVYLGNSGTSMRLLAGLLSAQAFSSVLTGDTSLSKRPMNRVAKPLREMGAVIETGAEGRPPLSIEGGHLLTGMHYDMPMASAQVKSCLLLAGMYASGETSVTEPAPTRDHTERMLRGFGYPVEVNGSTVTIKPEGKLTATNIHVPADISSAAFFLVAATIAEQADLTLTHVGVNPTRTGVLDILKLMGADITLENEREVGGEPVADIRVRSAKLKGIQIPEELVPLAIDEFPVLFVAAACAEGTTVLTGAAELRVKESDRIQVMADGLITLGIKAEPTADGIIIEGGQITSGEVWSHEDHRIAMSFVVASIRAQGDVRIRDCENVATSFPNFLELAQQCGINVKQE